MQKIPLITEATFQKLMNRISFGIVNNQILFYSEDLGTYVISQISEKQDYTVEDYALLPESAPYQLIDGKMRIFTSPTTRHQEIVGNLSFHCYNYIVERKTKDVLVSRCDIHFDNRNIVQPDIIYVSKSREHILKDWIMGAPEFIVEVLSPETEYEDTVLKMALYGKHDVIEYWIVKPEEQAVEVYHNHEQTMKLHTEAGMEDTIKSVAIEGFELEVKRIFE